MNRRSIWTLFFLALVFAVAGETAEQRGVPRPLRILDNAGSPVGLYSDSHALLIGIADYSSGWPDLESIPAELDRVAEVLDQQGFTVTRHADLDASGLKSAFEDFIYRHGLKRNNRLLIFFSGHGHTLADDWGEMGYIVPADAPNPDLDEPGFRGKAVSMNQVLTWAREIRSKHALFLFDSCFSGSVFKARNLPDRPPHISKLTDRPVRQFITAGSAGETVPAQSVFTPALVDALSVGLGDLNKDGFITGMELGVFLQGKVPRHADQTPQFGKIKDYSLSQGDFVFVSAGTRPSAATADASSAGTDAGAVGAPPPPPIRLQGNLQVNVNRPADVFLGGRLLGRAEPDEPLNQTDLPTGGHTVTVRAEGFAEIRKQVTIRRGTWEQLLFELRPLEAESSRLTVRSNVYGDRVFVDGEPKGSTRLDIELQPGSHEVRVEKEGYEPYEERVELEKGQQVTLMARLSRVRASSAEASEPRAPVSVSPSPLPPGVYDMSGVTGFDEMVLQGAITSSLEEGESEGTMDVEVITPSGYYASRVRVTLSGGRINNKVLTSNDTAVIGQTFTSRITRQGRGYRYSDSAGRRMTLTPR